MMDMTNTPDVRYGSTLALTRLGIASPGDRNTVAAYFAQLLRIHDPSAPSGQRTRPEIIALIDGISALLTHTESVDVSLMGMKLRGVEDVKLRVSRAYLAGIDISDSRLAFSNLTMCRMADARLANVDFRCSTLVKLMARHASFRDCDLSWCDLRGAVLICADLRGAGLVGSALDDAIFIGADLRGANLRSTDLTKANLEAADLRGAKADGATKLPRHLNAEERGLIYG